MEKIMNELTKDESKMLKGIAILFMVGLHLYNRTDIDNYYKSIIIINNYPLIYYISFIFEACVPIYCFCSGYAAYVNKNQGKKKFFKRLFKLIVNYWLVLLLTCITGILLGNKLIPGNVLDFLGNVFLYRISYVGAWWFIQTYVLLTLSSSYLIKLSNKLKPYSIFILSIIIYAIAYYFRMIHPIDSYYLIIETIINALVLYGTSLFPYVVGLLFKKYDVISFIRNNLTQHSSLIGICIISFCILLHIIIKSMFIAPFIAIMLICGYSLLHIDGINKKILLYFGNHSTNIWLVHMQFYMIFFSNVIFYTKTIVGCFVILLFLCLMTSYCINYLMKAIFKTKVISKIMN